MIKKSFTMICVALVVTAALVLTGCDLGGDDGGETATVASVTVSPSTASVAKGGTQAFTATVSGTNSPAQSVTWSVSGGGAGTAISAAGVLTVAVGESATTLTVKATSTVDTAKSGTATVTVTGGGGGDTKILSSIAVKTPPTKTTYVIGESLNLVGLVITATYSDSSTANISDTAKFSASGFNSSAAAASQTVTVSYTEGGVIKTATFTVTISPAQQAKTLSSIAVKTPPTKTTYVIGESLDLAGLVITATYSDSSTADISDTAKFSASGFSSSATAASQTVTVSYTEGGVTKTATFTVTISPADVDKTFTIGYEQGTIIIKNVDGETVTGITLSNSTVTLSADGTFTGVTWYVDGVSKGTSVSLELKATDYTAKTHSVTFTGWLNGSYLSSGPIPFTVTN